MDIEGLSVVVAVTLVVFATVGAWIESRLEKRDRPDYGRVLRQERRYREHMARGPVVERRRASRQIPRRWLRQLIVEVGSGGQAGAAQDAGRPAGASTSEDAGAEEA